MKYRLLATSGLAACLAHAASGITVFAPDNAAFARSRPPR